MEQLENEIRRIQRRRKANFLYSLISHYMLDRGNLVVAHAGIKEEMQGRGSGAVRSFCLYGETIRRNRRIWIASSDTIGHQSIEVELKVVYGHTPVPKAEWFNKTIDIDTGCVFGGELTASHVIQKKN